MSTLLGHDPDYLRRRDAVDTSREIAQQPIVWRQIARMAAESGTATAAFLKPLLERPDLRIVLTGAGTSAYVGEVLAPSLRRRLGRRVDAVATTDIVADPLACFAEDVPTLLVSFARSGDSPESVTATELATQVLTECWHLVVTCNEHGRLARQYADRSTSHVLLLPEAANDRGFAMTSSFTGMVLAGSLALGGPDEGLVERLATAAEQILVTRPPAAADLAARGYSRIVYLGSGTLHGAARESALKVLELTAGRVVAMAESALAFRHGPKSVLDDQTLVVSYESNDPYTSQYDRDMVAELLRVIPERNLVTVTGHAGRPARENAWTLPGIADVDDAALALPAVICAQLIGLHFSLALGLTPDNPFPGGEVNRVVQGAIMHPLSARPRPGEQQVQIRAIPARTGDRADVSSGATRR
ncbi:galactosamine 6-phosphate isomerase AgaS [Micromonospora pisi]|uniref:Galactosamine 6-phosphate isomerase AgaS n=1 Tax=Micromonospora pisi TaxID=589240 RepID=A0A495JGU6_9ACTN|nr:SIS domain-containing protein [Micromonospora pisi]RKR87788.1 galactosamine 6-phosphate isomerase AgaS [Micromonospora pisi]